MGAVRQAVTPVATLTVGAVETERHALVTPIAAPATAGVEPVEVTRLTEADF